MSRIVVQAFMTLDGVVQSGGGPELQRVLSFVMLAEHNDAEVRPAALATAMAIIDRG